MAKLTLNDLANLTNETTAVSTINTNNTAIETALENTLSRDGATPNTMGAQLDMNSNRILNLPLPVDDTEPARLVDVRDGITGPTGPSAWAAPVAWQTATAYVSAAPSSVVTQSGETYVCLVAHTSGVFATDLAASKWIKIATKGADGSNGAVAVSGTPTVNQIAAWVDSTTIKGVSITGLVKGNGASAPTAAVASTDYIAATTGSAIQKASSGGLTAAVAGTDYYNPGGTDVAVADGGTGSSTAAGALTNLAAAGQGKQTIFIPAAAMISRTTNGAAAGSAEMTTNKNMVKSLDFDTTTQEFAQFSVAFPKSWNLGTVTFAPHLSQLTTAAGNVVFGLAGVAVSSGDALDVAFGTAQTSDTTVGTANLEYVGPESSAITIAGTPAVGDRVMFQINRTVASDNLAQDARLHGIRLFFTTNAATDA